jgi:hypothetical protein
VNERILFSNEIVSSLRTKNSGYKKYLYIQSPHFLDVDSVSHEMMISTGISNSVTMRSEASRYYKLSVPPGRFPKQMKSNASRPLVKSVGY